MMADPAAQRRGGSTGVPQAADLEPARARRLRRGIIAVGVLALATFTTWVLVDHWRAYGRTLSSTGHTLTNLAIALGDKAESSLGPVDLLLQTTADWYRTPVVGSDAGVNEINEALALRSADIASVRLLAITDAQGRIVFHSRDVSRALADVSDRAYFIDQRDHPRPGVYVSGPLTLRLERRPGIVLSRRLDNPDGTFRGIVLAAVELDQFQRVYHSITLGRGSSIVLLRDDGTVLVREPPLSTEVVGQKFAELAGPPGSGEGTFSGLDDKTRLFATSRVPGFPLVAAVTLEKSTALEAWQLDLLHVVVKVPVMLALGSLAIFGLVRQLRRVELSEQALRASEQRYALAMEGANEGHWDWDLIGDHGGRSFLSPRLKELHGAGQDSPVTTLEAWRSQMRLHPDDEARWQAAIEAHFEGRTERYELEYRVGRPDGQWRWLHERGRGLRDAGGRAVRFVGSSTDITERKSAEQERERLERQLRHAHKLESMGTLAGGIAHDFNNILGAIIGYGELAQAKAAPGSADHHYLDNIMLAAERAKQLVEQILTFSRSGLGERVAVRVQDVVSETLELLAASLPSTVRLERHLNGGAAAIVGDPTQLHQVVMNLCTNANQAMSAGGVLRVELQTQRVPGETRLSHGTLAPGDFLTLRVSDTGTGIPAAVVDRIFDPFLTTKGVGQGTGLGLSLVHAIVSDLSGAIDVTTMEGKGTTFAIWLPIREQVASAPTAAPRDTPTGSGQTIMVVDDEPALVALAEETLAELGYEPIGFKSSVAALAAFRAAPERFDAVLTDETMPELAGTDFGRDVRKLRPDIPIVLMSGYAGPHLVSRANTVGFADILRKPLVRRDIAESLERVFAR
jgi:PAS domain S-box-containing protein